MGKLTKYTIKLIIASVCVWFVTVLIFSGVSGFSQSEVTNEDIEMSNDRMDIHSGATAEVADETTQENESEETVYRDGTYTGSAEGPHGPIEVEVTVEGGELNDIIILDHSEAEHISAFTLEELPSIIVDNNTADIDVRTGATVTSRGIINAVNDALEDAQ